MPELPEVEIIKRGLEGFLLRKNILRLDRVVVLSEKSFMGDQALVLGRNLRQVERRGKALILRFERGGNLLIHLRMTGQLVYEGEERFAAGHPDESFVSEMPGRHTRVYLEFSDGAFLYFNDQRKFGFVKAMTDEDLAQDRFLQKLGPEPWAMSAAGFYEKLQRRTRTSIKAAILDQSVIAGVGNIYADESLYYARVFPGRKTGELARSQTDKLLEGIKKVMEASIESGGSTMKDYVQADGTKGDYLDKFAKVFNRTGGKCERCGGEIKKIKVAGRGTHYCPECQK